VLYGGRDRQHPRHREKQHPLQELQRLVEAWRLISTLLSLGLAGREIYEIGFQAQTETDAYI